MEVRAEMTSRINRSLAALVLCLLCWPSFALAADPIDTFQFWRIRDGMSETDVLTQIGQPAQISEVTKSSALVPTVQGTVLREKRRYTYIYPSTSRNVDIYVTFEDGAVVDKAKVPR